MVAEDGVVGDCVLAKGVSENGAGAVTGMGSAGAVVVVVVAAAMVDVLELLALDSTLLSEVMRTLLN